MKKCKMFFVFLSFATSNLNLANFVDGLENVEYAINASNQEASFFITSENIVLFYQRIPNIRIRIKTENGKINHVKTGYQLPKNSIVSILTNWSKYSQTNSYLISFIDGNNCDFIFYSNAPNYSIPTEYLHNLRKCFYHFSKNSIIQVGEKNYTRFAFSNKNEKFRMISPDSENIFTKLNGITKIKHQKKNILAEEGDEDDEIDDLELTQSGGSFMLAISILFNIVGIIMYFIIGLAFGTDDCDCTCRCCCCCKRFWEDHNITNIDVDNRENPFFSETLMEFKKRLGRVDQE